MLAGEGEGYEEIREATRIHVVLLPRTRVRVM